MTQDNNTYVALRSKVIKHIYIRLSSPTRGCLVLISHHRVSWTVYMRCYESYNNVTLASVTWHGRPRSSPHSISTTQNLLIMCDSLVTTSSKEPEKSHSISPSYRDIFQPTFDSSRSTYDIPKTWVHVSPRSRWCNARCHQFMKTQAAYSMAAKTSYP